MKKRSVKTSKKHKYTLEDKYKCVLEFSDTMNNLCDHITEYYNDLLEFTKVRKTERAMHVLYYMSCRMHIIRSLKKRLRKLYTITDHKDFTDEFDNIYSRYYKELSSFKQVLEYIDYIFIDNHIKEDAIIRNTSPIMCSISERRNSMMWYEIVKNNQCHMDDDGNWWFTEYEDGKEYSAPFKDLTEMAIDKFKKYIELYNTIILMPYDKSIYSYTKMYLPNKTIGDIVVMNTKLSKLYDDVYVHKTTDEEELVDYRIINQPLEDAILRICEPELLEVKSYLDNDALVKANIDATNQETPLDDILINEDTYDD